MRAAVLVLLAACAVPAKHAPDDDEVAPDAGDVAPDATGIDAQLCSPIAPTGGARGLFHFDEASGQVATNAGGDNDALLGVGNNDEASDPERMAPARFGSGLRFFLADGDQVFWPSGVGDVGDHLIELWVRPGGTGGSLFATQDGTITLELASDPLRVVYTLHDRDGTGTASVTSPTVDGGAWHHVLASFKKPILYLWIDGVPVPTSTLDAGFRAGDITLGAGLAGELDEVYFATSSIHDDGDALARYCAP